MPDRISNAPDHLYDSDGLKVEDVMASLAQTPDPQCKIWVETSGEDQGDEGWLLGEAVEIQWGRDGAVYLRINKTRAQIKEDLQG